jgi:hypothetical protein
MACNYALALFSFRDDAIAVVLNGVFPLLVFATPPKEGQLNLDFADCPVLAAEFEQVGVFLIVPAAELSRLLTQEMCQELAPHEQKAVQYFRPRRVGDVIYNHWD